MRPRTLVTILSVFALVWWIVSTIRLNAGLVTMRLPFAQPIQLELWLVLLAGFGAGAGELDRGADLVAYSGGKALRGPHPVWWPAP